MALQFPSLDPPGPQGSYGTFEGVCIGGPYDKRSISHSYHAFSLPEYRLTEAHVTPRSPFEPRPMEYHEYTFTALRVDDGGRPIGVWLYRGLTLRDVYEKLLTAYERS